MLMNDHNSSFDSSCSNYRVQTTVEEGQCVHNLEASDDFVLTVSSIGKDRRIDG
jgi:hypothetical protein